MKIFLIRIEFGNGQKYTSVNIGKTMELARLKPYRKRLERVMSKRRGKNLTVNFIFCDESATDEVKNLYGKNYLETP